MVEADPGKSKNLRRYLAIVMAPQKPIYVCHRKWFIFLVAMFPVAIAFFGIFVFIITIPNVQDPFDTANLTFIIVLEIVLLLPAIYMIKRVFLKSKRIEFYEDFVRVYLSWGKEKLKDIPYSELELGRLKMSVFKGGITFHFKLSAKGDSKSSWDVFNGNIEKVKTPLYLWLLKKVGRQGDTWI
jgi:hypothetical protein